MISQCFGHDLLQDLHGISQAILAIEHRIIPTEAERFAMQSAAQVVITNLKTASKLIETYLSEMVARKNVMDTEDIVTLCAAGGEGEEQPE
jgi:hypothetical protein